jgi:NADH dehydrogenase [ubiquinone] 1 alpha subcomplex assembly factor 5
MGSHISPFAEIRDIGGLLTINGFTMLTIVRKISITIRLYVIVILGVLGWMRSFCSNASASYFGSFQDTQEIKVGYPSIFELMNDLKGMGENNASWRRKVRLNKDTLFAAGAIYQRTLLISKNNTKLTNIC